MTERLYPFQMPCSVCRVETWAEGWTGWTVSYRMRMQESSAWEYDVHSVGLCDDNGVNRVAKRVEEVLRRKYAPYQIEVLSMRVSSLQTRDWEGRLAE